MVCLLDSLTYHNNHSLSTYGFRVQKNVLGEGRNNNMKLKLSYERLMHKLGDLMLYITIILTKSAMLD